LGSLMTQSGFISGALEHEITNKTGRDKGIRYFKINL